MAVRNRLSGVASRTRSTRASRVGTRVRRSAGRRMAVPRNLDLNLDRVGSTGGIARQISGIEPVIRRLRAYRPVLRKVKARTQRYVRQHPTWAAVIGGCCLAGIGTILFFRLRNGRGSRGRGRGRR